MRTTVGFFTGWLRIDSGVRTSECRCHRNRGLWIKLCARWIGSLFTWAVLHFMQLVYVSLPHPISSDLYKVGEWPISFDNGTCNPVWSQLHIADHYSLRRACRSCCIFGAACFAATCSSTAEHNRSNCPHIPLQKQDTRRYMGCTAIGKVEVPQSLLKWGSMCSPASIAFLKVFTKRSAAPFEEGWYGVHLMCLMPLHLRK